MADSTTSAQDARVEPPLPTRSDDGASADVDGHRPWLVDLGRIPIVGRLRSYRRRDLGPDVGAGLAVTALMIPHGMAYAELAGLPAVTGLYTTVAALLAYALFGPSRLLLLGPDSSLAPLIAAAIALTVADGDAVTAVAVGSLLALTTGALCVLAGLTHLGSIAELLSRPVQLGYLNGLAVVMVVSQLDKLAGFSADGDAPIPEAIDIVQRVADGAVDTTALVLGIVVLAVILVTHRRWRKFPGVLIAVVGATAVVRFADLDVDVIGRIPEGFPRPTFPDIDASDLGTILLASAGLAWVTLTDTTALSRAFAQRNREHVDPNAEIMALGAANIGAGLVTGFPVSASTSRTSLAFAAGGRTQLVGIVSAVAVAALVVAGGSLVETLPSTALAAIVIAAAIALLDLRQLRWLYEVRRSEFVLAVIATVAVITLGVLNGLLVAVVLSLANFVRRVWRPYDAVLGRIDQRPGHHDVSRHPDAHQVPGLVVFRFDAPLFFANADHFVRRIEAVVDEADGPDPVRRVVVAAEPMTDVDTSGAAVLERVVRDLRARGIEFGFAGMRGPVKDHLYRYGLYEVVGADRFYETIGGAMIAFVEDHDVDWVDWTEQT